MEGLYQWVGNILFFLVLMNLTETILPSPKYGRYLRFFSGMVLILLVMRPLAKATGLEERLSRQLESLSFQTESHEFERRVLEIGQQQKERLVGRYESAVAEGVEAMAREAGLEVKAEVKIESDQEKENYGKINHIILVLRNRQEETSEEETRKIKIQIEPVAVGEKTTETAGRKMAEGAGGKAAEGKMAEGAGGKAAEAAGPGENTVSGGGESRGGLSDAGIEQLRRKVEEYYELEPEDLEIRLEE